MSADQNEYADIPSMTLQRIRDEINDELGRRAEAAKKRFDDECKRLSSMPNHYWTGRGTLCSLDNNVQQQPNHTRYKAEVSCPHCLRQLAINDPPIQLGSRPR